MNRYCQVHGWNRCRCFRSRLTTSRPPMQTVVVRETVVVEDPYAEVLAAEVLAEGAAEVVEEVAEAIFGDDDRGGYPDSDWG